MLPNIDSAAFWRKSSACDNNGSCVEVARLTASEMGARDSKCGDGGHVLEFSSREWRGFVAQVKAGEFDLL
ncbi:DUF397 domain-containing protein [Actinomadura scrupuli]|uniref:DUF397 domain-containing protein n=1 Tax=Actinomadura scrupuli TaxID=559629 RepID=UPI003D96D84F